VVSGRVVYVCARAVCVSIICLNVWVEEFVNEWSVRESCKVARLLFCYCSGYYSE
jgi:hypothetical protein